MNYDKGSFGGEALAESPKKWKSERGILYKK
jgi:hypothetical protein